MYEHMSLRTLVSEWARYLEERGHVVRRLPNAPEVLLSRNRGRRGYRWLLFHTEQPTRGLTAIEHETLAKQARIARKAREKAYLVIKFERPEAKVVVLPASRAVKARRLCWDKGGIPWGWQWQSKERIDEDV